MISPEDAALLSRIRDMPKRQLPYDGLDEDTRRRIYAFKRCGLARELGEAYIGEAPYGVTITPAGLDALSAYERAEQERKQLAQQRAAQQAAQEEKERAQAAEKVIEARKQRKHDYAVAAFGAFLGMAGTLTVEHFDSIVNALIKVWLLLWH